MAEMILVYDRDGKEYRMNYSEAQAAVSSGAYTPERVLKKEVKKAPLSFSSVMKVKEKKTGIVYDLPSLDAREAIKTGFFEPFVPSVEESEEAPASQKAPQEGTQELKTEVSPDSAPATPEAEQATFQSEAVEYPILSEKDTKEHIQDVLKQYGVVFRSNMTEKTLLGLWDDFLVEKGQK